MLASKMKDKCLKYKEPVSSRQNRINCNLCKKVLHLKCTELVKSQFQSYQKEKLFLIVSTVQIIHALNVANISTITLIVWVVISVINGFIQFVQI